MANIDWNSAIRYALLVQIAEAVESHAPYALADLAKIEAQGYKFLATIYGDDLATDVDPHLGDVVTFGFMAVSPQKELVVILRGTATLLEWIHDGSFAMVPSPVRGSAGLAEDGFSAVFKSLRLGPNAQSPTVTTAVTNYLQLGTATSVTVSGHSLGGALATLQGLDVALNTSCRNPSVYSFASPRTGNGEFASCFNQAVTANYRVANRQDLVPKLPMPVPLPFVHVDPLCELVSPMNAVAYSVGCLHHLTTYLWLMGTQVGSSSYPLTEECVCSGLQKLL